MNLTVKTPCGYVKGIESNVENVLAFKGIRYAYANRFEYPKMVTFWDGIYDASEYKACCYQPRAFYDETKNLKKIFYYNEFRKNQTYAYSEDCLFLNIFVHKDTNENDKLPVIVYIHGGGYKGGCGHELHFDGPKWPLYGVIAVTINYRLGPLGFLCCKEQKDIIGKTGNFGLYDQVTALKWIKENIGSFGGDSNNITIMGQSAGAMSVQQLCMSPLTDNLFNKAVMSSGGGVNKMLNTPNVDKYYKLTDKIMELSSCKTFDDLKELQVDKLYEAFEEARKGFFGLPCSPVIDNELILGDLCSLLKQGSYKKIPYMIGSNSEDMASPFMAKMANNWCKKQEVNAYCYMFNHQLPGDDNGAWHSADLWYFFGTLKNGWRPFDEVDYALSNNMVRYLTNFAKNGDPNDNNLPLWTPSNNSNLVMYLGNNTYKMSKVKYGKLWRNMLTKKAVGE